MNNVWRVHLKSKGNTPKDFCFDRKLVGLGWPIDIVGIEEIDRKIYEERYYSKYRKPISRSPRIFIQEVQIGDLIWTRNEGKYFLGKVLTEWYYDTSEVAQNADIVNQRKINWKEIGTMDKVPGKVIASFRSRSAFQRVHSETVALLSQFLFNDRIPNHTSKVDLFDLIDDQELEDIIGLYLQLEKGYTIVPSSCKKDTELFEYSLIHRKTGEVAFVQVKSGRAIIDLEPLKKETSPKVFLYSHQTFPESLPENLEVINPTTIRSFISENRNWFPENIQNWMKLTSKINNN